MDISDLVSELIEFNRYSGLAGVAYFLFFIKNWKSFSALIFYILLVSLLFDLGIYTYIKYIYPNSYYGSNWWILVNYFFMSWLFIQIIPQFRNLIIASSLIFILGSIISFGFYYSFWEANTFTSSFSSLSFILFSIMSFLYLMNLKSETSLKQMPIFYLLIAFLSYYALVFFKSIFMNYLVFQLKVTWEQYWPVSAINLIANVSKNFILFYVIVLIDKGYKDPIIDKTQ